MIEGHYILLYVIIDWILYLFCLSVRTTVLCNCSVIFVSNREHNNVFMFKNCVKYNLLDNDWFLQEFS